MIEEGDRVNVYWENLEPLINVIVRYRPCATGDSWHLEGDDGKIYYVQFFSQMEKIMGK